MGSTSRMPRAKSGDRNCSSQLEVSQEALDRPCLTVPVLRSEVDTGFDVAPARRLLPQPHLAQQRLVGRIVFQKSLANDLELVALAFVVDRVELCRQIVEYPHTSEIYGTRLTRGEINDGWRGYRAVDRCASDPVYR